MSGDLSHSFKDKIANIGDQEASQRYQVESKRVKKLSIDKKNNFNYTFFIP